MNIRIRFFIIDFVISNFLENVKLSRKKVMNYVQNYFIKRSYDENKFKKTKMDQPNATQLLFQIYYFRSGSKETSLTVHIKKFIKPI